MSRSFLLTVLLLTLILQPCSTKPGGIPFDLAFHTKSETFQPVPAQHGVADEDSVIFIADFESTGGMNAWTTLDVTNPGPTWHIDYYNAWAGHSWWSGRQSLSGYDNTWLQYLVTDTFNLSDTTYSHLTFRLYWAVEPGEGPLPIGYSGWDGCNVWIWNGFSWQILQPDFPSYTDNSLYGFGWFWGMGPGIPGWTGISGWTTAQFDLTGYAIYSNLRLRFAFGSDDWYCTANDPTLKGFFLDSIWVREGQTTKLFDDAEGSPYPGPCTVETGAPKGDFWEWATTQYHSQTHSWTCEDRFFLSNAFVSPAIVIPSNLSTTLSYWVYCDMPDFNGDNDLWLDDYYYIEAAPITSSIWVPIAYDYAHAGSQAGWVERTDGLMNNVPIPSLSLDRWRGQTIKIRFRAITDGNNDGGNGSGLFVDDVILTSHTIPDHDVGAFQLIIPFPTYQGQLQIADSVKLINYGLQNQSQVPAFWSVNGVSYAILPFYHINSEDTLTQYFNWTPPGPGFYDFRAYTALSGDQIPGNDTTLAGIVEVTPAGLFELGYDHRQISYLPETDLVSFNVAQGGGAMVHFTPEADGLIGELYGNTIKAMFRTTGTINLHIFENGSPGNPGNEVYSRAVTIDSSMIYPNWAIIEITETAFLQGGHPDFWVWLEVTSQNNTPHITGFIKDAFSTDHFFYHNTGGTQPTIINFNIRATMTGTASVDPVELGQPTRIALLESYPNPFNSTATIILSLPSTENARLEVFDLLGRCVEVLHDSRMTAGGHTITWAAEGIPSGSYWLRLSTNSQTLTKRIVLLK